MTIASVTLRFRAPRRFQEFWWPGYRRSLIKVLSPGVCEPSFWQKIRLEVGYSQLPASKPSALINWFSVRMRNEKNTAHQYSFLTYSCAICIQSWKCTGNQKSWIIANTSLKSCCAVCINQGDGLVQAPQTWTLCILPCCPIFFRNNFNFWPGPRAEI